MRVRYRQSGGFGGLSLGADLDTDKLPRSEAQELASLVKQAGLDKIGVKKNPKGRDLITYEITVEEDGQTTKAAFDDMTLPAEVQPLLDFLNRHTSARPLDG